MMRQYLMFLCQRWSLLIVLCGMAFFAQAQPGDQWSGTWQMKYQPWPHIPPIDVQLQIAAPVEQMLYPARLTITHHTFKGIYELLLVKKNDHQLGVGRNKVPISEEPYGLGPWMMYLNGVLDYAATDTGVQLELKRLWFDNLGVFMSGVYDNEFYTNTKVFIREFLYQEEVALHRVDDTPWTRPGIMDIIHNDSVYYGVYDPIATDNPILSFAVQDEERYDHDTVTVVHNGRLIAHDMPIEEAMDLDSLILDTGENYIAFFADNYGSVPPNTANFIIGTEGSNAQLYTFDFSNRSNAFATVMVARFQYQPPTPTIADTAPAAPSEVAPVADKPATSDTVGVQATDKPQYSGRTAGRRDIRIGQWTVPSDKVQLEIWDEQLEDGDIISVQVNGAPVAEQVTVSRLGQRLGITLRPGSNRIMFRAENLGRIPPNTAALRITAGDQERVYQLSTDFERNNVLDITVQQ